MSTFPYKNPISSEQLNGAQSVQRSEVFGTNFSVLSVGGYMEVFNTSDLIYTINGLGPIEYSGNTIPIDFLKGTGDPWSPDVLTLNSDNISSGRRRLGMLVYVYENDQTYQFRIDNYESLWSAATASTGTVVISDFGTTVYNSSVAGQNFINAWTASTIEDISGETHTTAVWKKYSSGTGGGSGFTSVRINNVSQFTATPDSFINFSGINISILSASTNTLVFSAGTGGGSGGTSNLQYFVTGSTPSGVTINNGDRWFDTDTGAELVWINDGDSSQWIEPNIGQINSLSADTLYVTGSTINSTIRKDVSNVAGCSYAAALAGCGNTAAGLNSVVVGGMGNTSCYGYSFVGGGANNTSCSNYSTVSGGYGNTSSAEYSTVGGGYCNTSSGQKSTIGGGVNNNAICCFTTIGGGYGNTSSGYYSIVVGGLSNTSSGNNSFIGGGEKNSASNSFSIVGGGSGNSSSGYMSTVVGGNANTSSGNHSFIGGGQSNNASSKFSTIGGGQTNSVYESLSTISGGYCNQIFGTSSFIGGGIQNQISKSSFSSLIVGGCFNCIEEGGEHSVVVGGRANLLNGKGICYSSIVGGLENTLQGLNCHSSIVGGYQNTFSTYSSTSFIGGGCYNQNVCNGSSVVGGWGNYNYSLGGGIVGGVSNILAADSTFSSIYKTESAYNRIWVYGDLTASYSYGNTVQFFNNYDSTLIRGNVTTSTYSGGYTCVDIDMSTGSSFYGDSVLNNISKLSPGGSFSFIGGGETNIVSSLYSVIGGGIRNRIAGGQSFIGDGTCNLINGIYSFIGNGGTNCTNGEFTSIVNGQSNQVVCSYSSVVNGFAGCIQSCFSTIGNGCLNVISGSTSNFSQIFNGCGSVISGCNSTIIHGGSPISVGCGSFIQGNNSTIIHGATAKSGNWICGDCNLIGNPSFSNISGATHTSILNGSQSCVIGGTYNSIVNGIGEMSNSSFSNISNGNFNIICNSFYSFIGSGCINRLDRLNPSFCQGSSIVNGQGNNTCYASNSFIGGGNYNSVSGTSKTGLLFGVWSFIGNGFGNGTSGGTADWGNGIFAPNAAILVASGPFSFIGNGFQNIVSNSGATVLNGYCNRNEGWLGTIINGSGNSTTACYSFIGGGCANVITGRNSAIVGGVANSATTTSTFIFGGTCNLISGSDSFIGGGSSNCITTSSSSVVGGGQCNIVTGKGSFIGSGFKNTVSGTYSGVLGGCCNTVTGNGSFAVGTGLTASDNGTLYSNNSCIINKLSLPVASTTCNNATCGYISFRSDCSQIFDDGNLHIHNKAANQALWINTNNGAVIIGGQSPVSGGSAASGVIMGSGSTTIKAYANIYGSKTYTIGSYGYLATGIGAGTGTTTTAPYSLYTDNRIEASEFDATSDERLKDIHGEIGIDESIELITKVKPIKFTWKNSDDKGIKIGYSAQQVEKAGFRHLIGHIPNEKLKSTTDDDGFTSPEGFQLTMNYDQINPYHGVVIKHLLDEIDGLKKEINELKSKI